MTYSVTKSLTRFAIGILFLVLPYSAFAALPAGFVVDTVATGFSLPTALVFTADGSILVAEKSGTVKLVQNGVVRGTPVIILTDVNDYADHGLLGIALDATEQYLYLLYTYENSPAAYQGPKTARLVRVTLDATHTAIAGSAVVILGTVGGTPALPSCRDYAVGADCMPSDGASHSIADVSFGPDGKLYVSEGDASSFDYVDILAQRSQNLDSFSGKVLRINPDGTAPADNPFYTGNPNENRSKVYAYGFRNPFRFSFRPSNGAMFLGDVGWYTAEEINVVTPGGNYGWPCHEGNSPTEGYNCTVPSRTDPLYSYAHDAQGSGSAVGGVFYTGSQYPSSYNGTYFFGDFSQNWIKTMTVNPTNGLVSVQNFMTNAGGPVDFATDANGDIYYISIYSGQIRKIRAVTGNRNPDPVISALPTSGLAPLPVNFSSVGSSDPDGNPLSYAWTFGDGGTSALANPSYTYATNGIYTAKLTLTDGQGGAASTSIAIVVGNRAPTASIVNPPNGSFYAPGQVIPLTGLGVDPEEGTLPASAYAWRIILHHNTHYHILETLSGVNPSFVAPDHGADPDVYIEVELTATDSTGLSQMKSITMNIAPPATVAPYHILTATNGTLGLNVPATITTRVGNTGAPTPFLVDMELYDQNNVLVSQRFFDATTISTGGVNDYVLPFTPTTNGTYRVAVGLIYEGWRGLYQWVNNALTFIVSSLWTPSAPNGALSFDGVDDYIETELWNIEEANGFTLETRFVPESFVDDMYFMSKAYASTTAGIDWAFGVRAVSPTEGQLLFMLRTNEGGLTTITGGTVALGEYVHATAVYNGTTMELFKNGVSVGVIPKIGTIATGPHHVWLGARADALTNAFHGRIDEIRVWNEPQSFAEINQWKDGELTQKENGLIKDWRFNEGFGQYVIDSSNSGHHGVLGSTSGADANDPTRLGGKYPTSGVFLPVLGVAAGAQNPIPPTSTTTIDVPVTNTGDGSGFMIVNIEIYDPLGNRILQQYFDGEGFAPGETRTFKVPFVPTGLGDYRVAVGLVKLFWTDVYSWTNSAMIMRVSDIVATPFALSHTSSIVTDPSTGIGDQAIITTTIANTGSSLGAGIIDFEIYNPFGVQVYQQYYENEQFTGNQSRTFTANFTPTTAGTYRVAVGLIHPGWSGLYQWVNNAVDVSVGGAGTTTSSGTTVFDEGYAAGWQDWSWDVAATAGTPARTGLQAITVSYTSAWGGFYLHHNGFDTTGKSALHFFVRSVGATAPVLQVTAFDSAGNPLTSRALAPYLAGAINDAGYVEVIVPLADLSIPNTTTKGFMIQGVTGNIEPAYLIDDVTFN